MKRNDVLTELKELYAVRCPAIRSRLADFAAVPPNAYFFELVYCLLTPQSRAEHADRVVAFLKQQNGEWSEQQLVDLLGHKEHYIRFHNTKAKRILVLKNHFPTIHAMILQTGDSRALRAWLVAKVNGLGWKEASHFLRNIGHRNLAILDRHILRNLVRIRVIRSLPTTLTPSRYLAIERAFLLFADKFDIPMDELDLLFWSKETGKIMK